MLFEALKLGVRIEQRILIVETRYIADIQDAVLHSIDPAPAIGVRVRRKAKCVGHSSGWITVVRQFPQFLDADAVDLWFATGIKIEPLSELFG